MQSSPRGQFVGVPFGMDVNAADFLDLLCATVAVDVMFTENDTPCPNAATFKKKKEATQY